MQIEQKLFMENFDPVNGAVAYVVENNNGDRIARAEFKNEDIKTYHPETMDFFVLSYFPKIINKTLVKLFVEGPLSINLYSKISGLGPTIITENLVDPENREYSSDAIDFFKIVFEETNNLNKTLEAVFNYYK